MTLTRYVRSVIRTHTASAQTQTHTRIGMTESYYAHTHKRVGFAMERALAPLMQVALEAHVDELGLTRKPGGHPLAERT